MYHLPVVKIGEIISRATPEDVAMVTSWTLHDPSTGGDSLEGVTPWGRLEVWWQSAVVDWRYPHQRAIWNLPFWFDEHFEMTWNWSSFGVELWHKILKKCSWDISDNWKHLEVKWHLNYYVLQIFIHVINMLMSHFDLIYFFWRVLSNSNEISLEFVNNF